MRFPREKLLFGLSLRDLTRIEPKMLKKKNRHKPHLTKRLSGDYVAERLAGVWRENRRYASLPQNCRRLSGVMRKDWLQEPDECWPSAAFVTF